MSFLGATFREPCLQAAKMGWRVINNMLSSRKSHFNATSGIPKTIAGLLLD